VNPVRREFCNNAHENSRITIVIDYYIRSGHNADDHAKILLVFTCGTDIRRTEAST